MAYRFTPVKDQDLTEIPPFEDKLRQNTSVTGLCACESDHMHCKLHLKKVGLAVAVQRNIR